MDNRLGLLIALLLAAIVGQRPSCALEHSSSSSSGSGNNSTGGTESGLLRSMRHVYAQCADSEDIFWCCKLHGARLLGRALKVQQLSIVDGVSLVRRSAGGEDTRTGRASLAESQLNNRDLEHMSSKSLDALLLERFLNFLHSHQLQVNLPRLLRYGEHNSQHWLQSLLGYLLPGEAGDEGEGRKKKDDKKYLGPFIAAVLLKTAILKMAYHSIAIVAGKALIVGKIALIISAIIGLKKLVSHDGGEKTTYEIVKHPQVQQSHTYSSSHQGDFGDSGGHDGGSYHRSIDDEMMMQDKAYHAWMPHDGANVAAAAAAAAAASGGKVSR